MLRVLFVDDEPWILNGLQRMLHGQRGQWEMAFVETGEAALALLGSRPFDVVVSDMRMPGMDGVQLLTEVKQRHPGVVRIILSGHADKELTLRSVGPAHQFLSKPCGADELRSTIGRACALKSRLASPELETLAASLGSLPSLPALYNEIQAEISAPAGSLDNVGRIIARDIAMTAKVLQLVNSAFFGLRQRVSDPAIAVRFLGLETIKALVLSVQVFSKYERDPACEQAIRELWSSSMRVGAYARIVGHAQGGDRELVDQAFFAGMLHQVGQLLLLTHAPAAHERLLLQVRSTVQPDIEAAEREALGGAHTDLGAYLLGIWGLPSPITEAVAFHHQPMPLVEAGFCPLTCVHAAAAIAAELAGAEQGGFTVLDGPYLERLGLAARYPEWLELCRAASEVKAA